MQTRNINNTLLKYHAEIKTFIDDKSAKVILKKISIGEKNIEINLIGTGLNEHQALLSLEKIILSYQKFLNQMDGINSFPELILTQYALNSAIVKQEEDKISPQKKAYDPTKPTIW